MLPPLERREPEGRPECQQLSDTPRTGCGNPMPGVIYRYYKTQNIDPCRMLPRPLFDNPADKPPRFCIGHPVHLYVDESHVKGVSRTALKNCLPDDIITRDPTESKSFTANGIPVVVAVDFAKTYLPCLLLNHRAIGRCC